MPEMHYLERELHEKLRSDSDIWDFLRQSCLDGLWYWDLENLEHEWMSPELWELFGFDPATMEHSPDAWQDLIHPDDLATAQRNFEAHINDPNCPYDQVVRYRHADGHMIWVRCRGLAVRDSTGKAVRMMGAHTDLTRFVREAEARGSTTRQLSARHVAVLNAVQSAVIGLDKDRNVATLNEPARHLLGGLAHDPPMAWPSNIRFLDSTDMTPLDASADPVNRAVAGARLNGEVHLMTRGVSTDQARYVRVSSAQINEAESDVKTVVVLDDVSEHERNRQQIERQSRLDALGQLTGGIAHDFNNLLSTILYSIDLVHSETQTERSSRLLDGALQSIERGRQLTNRLLAFAKRQPDRPTTRSVQEVMTDFQAFVEPTIEEQIDLVFELPPAKLGVHCDQPMLENAMLNLVLNSRDAIMRNSKGGKITIKAREISHAEEFDVQLKSNEDGLYHQYVEILVSDDGPGMSEEIRRRATDPFFSTKSSNSGTGLGLSMVYGFAQQSDGALQIYSETGVGTTVGLILPRGKPSGEASAPAKRPEIRKGDGQRILVVEDEEILLSMMVARLKDMGYIAIPFADGMAAWNAIEAGLSFDGVLSDVVMPGGLGGFELARRVADAYPDVPLLLMSGYVGYSREEKGGLDVPVLQKPCMPELLANSLYDLFHPDA